VLDGSKEIIPTSNYGDNGYIGNRIGDRLSELVQEARINLHFTEVHHSLLQGLTITWSDTHDEYATNFSVEVYNNDVSVAYYAIADNTDVKSVVYMDISEYNRIEIVIWGWCLPHRRPRIENILIGVEKVYSRGDLFSFSHQQEVDPISASLPKSEISFSVDNSDNSYNPNNPNSISKYLMERQEIKARYGYKIGDDIEWIDAGTFYISEWDAPQNGLSATFKARDLLEFMTGTYDRGVYSDVGKTLYNLAIDVLQDAGLPLDEDGTVKWIVDDSLKYISTLTPLPVDTHANCLQLIANAGGCVLYQDRQGKLRIEKLTTSNTDYDISLFNSYSKPEITLSKPLKQVEVSCYTPTIAEEATELYKGVMSYNGVRTITVTYPSTAVNVTASVLGGTLVSAEYFANKCILKVSAAGEVKITVSGYTLTSSSTKVITASGESGETITVDNPLITSESRATAIGTWIENYMKNRIVLDMSWRVDPRIDALDIITNDNGYNVNNVIMTSVNFKYNGAFRGSGEGRVI
jgi:hypothetical protein